MGRSRSAGLLLVAGTALACGAAGPSRPLEPTSSAPAAQPSVPASLASSDPRGAAADRVTIDGRAYRIAPAGASSTFLWRDFMPITPPGGRPLAASVSIVADDGRPFPETLTADHLWVFGPEVWEPASLEVRRSPEAPRPSEIVVFASDGPKWEPGIKVDLVVRLRSAGLAYLVRIAGIPIDRTS